MKFVLLLTFLFGMVETGHDVAEQEPVDGVEGQVYSIFEVMGRSDEFACAAYIFERESRWDPAAVGDRGRSWGLGQRYTTVWGMPPLPWNIDDQVAWFTWYADQRYGNWCEAMEGWKRNREVYGWGWW